MANRFANFKWNDSAMMRELTRADVLALVDQLALSLTKRAHDIQADDQLAASVLGHIGTALQDTRCELYTRIQGELESDAWDTNPVAVYGEAANIRANYKAWGGVGGTVLRRFGKRMLRAAVNRVGW